MLFVPSRFGRNNNAFRADRPLTDDEIRKYAPSIFAEDAHESRSKNYTFIPTSNIVTALRQEGYEPFMVAQTRVQDPSRADFTKHLIRLRKSNEIAKREMNEVIIVNSHDGLSSYQLYTGVYRLVCSNGMVRFDQKNEIRVPHRGDVVNNVIEGVFRVVDDFELLDQHVDKMKGIELSAKESRLFAESALIARYGDSGKQPPISADDVLTVRRRDDRSNDFWTRFNVVQENLIRGGLRGRTENNKPTTTRAVTGINQNLALNAALWHLAEKFAELKNA